MNYTNQRRINIVGIDKIQHKEGVVESFLAPIKWDSINTAMRDLSGNGLKLWLYLISWAGKEQVFFSPSGIRDRTGMSEAGARNALDELIRKHYVKPPNDGGLTYVFSPIPFF